MTRRLAAWALVFVAATAAVWSSSADTHVDAPHFVDANERAWTLDELVADSRPAAAIVMRVHAEWCGTCRVQASSTAALQAAAPAVRMVDVLIADDVNGGASRDTIARWQRRVPSSVSVLRADLRPFDDLFASFAPLPWVVVIDTASGRVRQALANPSSAVLRDALGVAAEVSARYDDRFTIDQWSMIQQMRMPDVRPPDPGNRLADDGRAALLGETLFFDTRLSPANRACASCHSPDLLFTNGKDVASEGVGPGVRNVPTILHIAHARAQLWDGRADSLWSQAVIPFEDPTELGSSRLFVAHAVWTHHRAAYEGVFGPLPSMDDVARFPRQGGPATAEWARMAPVDRTAVSRVLANVGKALAAFERGIVIAPNALDRYAAGGRGALSDAEKDGLQAFFQAGCAQCHYGPRLSDEAYHNLRFPTGRPDRTPDRGRAVGLLLLRSHEFSATGAFSDVPPTGVADTSRATPEDDARFEGAFRTPGLRGVALTMPYGHGGGFGGLRSVLDAHRTGGLPPSSPFAVGTAERWAQGFDPTLVPKIQAFLLSLRADPIDERLTKRR